MAYKSRLALPDAFYEFPFPEDAKPGESARFKFRILTLRERLAMGKPAEEGANGDPTKRVVDGFEILRKTLVGWEDLEEEKKGPVRFEAGGVEILPTEIVTWALGKAVEINYGIDALQTAKAKIAEPAAPEVAAVTSPT